MSINPALFEEESAKEPKEPDATKPKRGRKKGSVQKSDDLLSIRNGLTDLELKVTEISDVQIDCIDKLNSIQLQLDNMSQENIRNVTDMKRILHERYDSIENDLALLSRKIDKLRR